MHIGVFSYYYFPIINGVTITIADWKRVGEKAGYKFTVCVPNLGNNQESDVLTYPAVPLSRRFGITVPMFPKRFLERSLRAKIDILHVHHPFYIGNLALFMKKKFGIPLVFTYHTRYTDYISSYFPWASGRFMGRWVRRGLTEFMNQCDAVTVANETLRQELLDCGVHAPIFLVPPGIDTTRFARGDRANTRKRLCIGQHDNVLLYVGRLAKEKNIYFLLQALALIHKKAPRMKMLLVGHGIEERKLKRFVEKHNLTNNVIFARQENSKTIPDIYASADIFVYASQTETYGRVVVEAMATGLPIVALAGPSIVDILKDGITGRVIFQKSPRVFAAVVLETIRDTKKRLLFSAQAKKEARQTYDSQISWKKLLSVYENLYTAYHQS